jgi:hypothetical protein
VAYAAINNFALILAAQLSRLADPPRPCAALRGRPADTSSPRHGRVRLRPLVKGDDCQHEETPVGGSAGVSMQTISPGGVEVIVLPAQRSPICPGS